MAEISVELNKMMASGSHIMTLQSTW